MKKSDTQEHKLFTELIKQDSLFAWWHENTPIGEKCLVYVLKLYGPKTRKIFSELKKYLSYAYPTINVDLTYEEI